MVDDKCQQLIILASPRSPHPPGTVWGCRNGGLVAASRACIAFRTDVASDATEKCIEWGVAGWVSPTRTRSNQRS